MPVAGPTNYTNPPTVEPNLGSNGGSITSTATSFNLDSDPGSGWPTSNFAVRIEDEFIWVGSRTTTACSSCTRGVDGSSNVSHNDGLGVKHVVIKSTVDQIRKDISSSGTYANRPSAARAGNIYRTTDGFYTNLDTGSDYELYGPVLKLVDPTLQTWAWVNQGSAVVTTTNGGINLKAVGRDATADDVKIRKKTKSASYIIDAFLVSNGPIGKNFLSYGIGFRESSSGKLHLLQIQFNSGLLLSSAKYTDEATFSANYVSYTLTSIPQILRIADDNTNRILSVSNDGQNFVQLHSVGRTDFLTANEVLFFAEAINQATINIDVNVTLFSWYEH